MCGLFIAAQRPVKRGGVAEAPHTLSVIIEGVRMPHRHSGRKLRERFQILAETVRDHERRETVATSSGRLRIDELSAYIDQGEVLEDSSGRGLIHRFI